MLTVTKAIPLLKTTFNFINILQSYMDIVVEKRKTATQPIFWLVMLMAYLDPYLFHSVIYIYISFGKLMDWESTPI